MAVEENQEGGLDKDGEAGEVSSMLSQPPELQEPTASNSPSNTVRKFRPAWKNVYPWLLYDEEKGMSCSFCVKHKKNNAVTKGTTNFRSSTRERHVAHHDHVDALRADAMQGEFQRAARKALNEKEEAVLVGLKAVYWVAEEQLPMHKYESLMSLLAQLQCRYVGHLARGKHATYTSDVTANDMLDSIATVIRNGIDNKLLKSPFVSLFIDESTDIAVHKKLAIYGRVLDPETFEPSTHFVTNVRLEYGTGKAISEKVKTIMEEKGLKLGKVMGLGTDGASVMTGPGVGVTGHFLRENPMMVNIHCMAHRLALVSSQAGASVKYLKECQEILTGIYYYMKASSCRTDRLQLVQKLLNEPVLKVKEVHEIRWLAVYQAVETDYRSLNSVLTFFRCETSAKGKGYYNEVIQHDFVGATYLLMDVLSIISKLCLVFQKKDLDVSMVEVHVDHCFAELQKLKEGKLGRSTYLDQLKSDITKDSQGKMMFKGNHPLKGNNNIDLIKVNFIDKIVENLNTRFPKEESNIIYAFGVLGLRPVSLLSPNDLEEWGNSKLEMLINHFGKEKEHK